jgi:hypothetical protein
MIWVAGRSPTLVSYSLRGVAMNLKATTLTYLAILRLVAGVRASRKKGCRAVYDPTTRGCLCTQLLREPCLPTLNYIGRF